MPYTASYETTPFGRSSRDEKTVGERQRAALTAASRVPRGTIPAIVALNLQAKEHVVATFPEKPAHPERICWGCDKLCPVRDLACGNGTERTPHPIELFGEDWKAWCEAQGLSLSLEPEPRR